MARAPRRIGDRPRLSPDRAFVVQLADGREGAGRVEHLTSGEARRFASLEELIGFMARFRRRRRPRSPLGLVALLLAAALAANPGPAFGQVEFIGSHLTGNVRAGLGDRFPCVKTLGPNGFPIENASLVSQEFPCSFGSPPGSTIDASMTAGFQLDPPAPAVGEDLRGFTLSLAGSLDVDVTQAEVAVTFVHVTATVFFEAVAGQSFTLAITPDFSIPEGVVFGATRMSVTGPGRFVIDSTGLDDRLERSGVFPESGESSIDIVFTLSLSTTGTGVLLSDDVLLDGSLELAIQFGPPRGACCPPAGGCAELTLEGCQAVGDFRGADTTCASPGICDVDEAIVDWTSAPGGAFATSSNWTPATVPDEDQTARFALSGSYPVGVTSARVRRLLVRLGAMFLSGGTLETSEIDLSTPSVAVGENGRLNLAGGLLKTSHVTLGDGGPGTAEVSGELAEWTSTGRLVVGQAATGELRINDHARVTTAESRIGEGAAGSVVIQDGESVDVVSKWKTGNLAVGSGAPGTLSVLSAAVVESENAVLGLASGGDGTVVVAGTAAEARSVWFVGQPSGTLTVGQGGRGLVRIEDGAAVSAGPVRVSRGSVQIAGTDSLFVASRLEVGGADFGFLTATGGGEILVSTDVIVSGEGASTGSVQLFGGSDARPTRLVHEELRVHRGNVRLFGGARAQGTSGVVAGPLADVLLQGVGPQGPSTWELTDRLVIGGEGGTGTITLASGLLRVPSCFFFLPVGGRLAGVGTLERVACPPGSGGGPEIEPLIEGEIEPGVQVVDLPPQAVAAQGRVTRPTPRALTIGELVVVGNLALGPTAVVRPLVAGPGQAGVLHVTGNTTLDGTLEITPADGYLPSAGDTFEVMRVEGTTTGAFAATQVRGVADDFAFSTTTEGGAMRLVAESDAQLSPCADTQDNDGDGRTDCADPACAGDLACATSPAEVCGNCRDDDGNGLVDLEDPVCCGGVTPGTLTIAAGKLRPRANGSRLRLALALRGTAVDPAAASDVLVQVAPVAGAPLCARIPAVAFARQGKRLRFRDRRRVLGSARGLDAIVLRSAKQAARLSVKGRRTALVPPTAAGPLRVAVALRPAGGAEREPRCAAGQRTFDATRKGVLVR